MFVFIDVEEVCLSDNDFSLLFIFARFVEDVIMVPSEPPPMNREYSSQPFYNPSQPPRNENPYGVPPQNPSGNFNPYVQQPYTPYPPEQQKPLNSY